MRIEANSVRSANRRFYDLVADVYEKVDGRRRDVIPTWLMDIMRHIAQKAPVGPYLDIGCGTGWLIKCAAHFFSDRYGCDISPVILKHARGQCRDCISNQAEALPYKNQSFAVISLFATLHHLPEWGPVVEEIHRVLKPGGWLYTDHDIDSVFLDRFRWPLSIYRGLRNASGRYHEACPGITKELYFLSEIHENTGVNAIMLERMLKRAGFASVTLKWHWLGIHPIFDLVGGIVGVRNSPGFAPNLRIIAQK